MKKTYVLREGRLVPKAQARVAQGAYVISDEMNDVLSHADGRRYSSKAKYRATLRAKGYEEVGNDYKGLMDLERNKAPVPAFEPILKEQLDRIGWRGD